MEQAHPLSQCAKEVIKMRLCEKRMLMAACRYCQTIQQKMNAILNQQDLKGLSYAELLKKMEDGRMKERDDLDREGIVSRDTGEGSLAAGDNMDANQAITQPVRVSSLHSLILSSAECTGTVDTESEVNDEQNGQQLCDKQTASLTCPVDSCPLTLPTIVPQQESTSDLHGGSKGQSSDKVTVSQQVQDDYGSLGLEELVVTNKSS